MDQRGPETSFTSGENGHKIAFDPRDLSETEERSKQPKLTLMEEVLLLGLKDKQVSLERWIQISERIGFVYVARSDF
jgi:Golgi phosphoprotein 3